ncbi:hypothetical protein ABZX51_002107 [Aspergillus tubingensis]
MSSPQVQPWSFDLWGASWLGQVLQLWPSSGRRFRVKVRTDPLSSIPLHQLTPFTAGGVQQYLQYIYGEAFGFLAAWTWAVAVVPASLAILSIVFVESIYSATGVTDQPDRMAHKLLSSLVLLIISMANSVSTQFSTRLNTFFLTTKFAAIALTVVAGLGFVLYHLARWDRDNSREPQDWLTRVWFGCSQHRWLGR